MSEKYQKNWSKSVTAPAMATSEPFFIPNHIKTFSVGIANDNLGTGIVQFTLSNVDAVEAGTANWHDWSIGDVIAGVDGLNYPVMAIRIVSTGAFPKTVEVCA